MTNNHAVVIECFGRKTRSTDRYGRSQRLEMLRDIRVAVIASLEPLSPG